MKEIKHIPSLRDMEWSKEDFIIFQLQIISRELIFANSRARQELHSERGVKEVLDLCIGAPTLKELTEQIKRKRADVKQTLDRLMIAGLVESSVDKDGETHYEALEARGGWMVICRRPGQIVLMHCGQPGCVNILNPCAVWGPFPTEPHARAFANAHFPGWRCTCP